MGGMFKSAMPRAEMRRRGATLLTGGDAEEAGSGASLIERIGPEVQERQPGAGLETPAVPSRAGSSQKVAGRNANGERRRQGTTILTGGSIDATRSDDRESDCVDLSVPIGAARQNIEIWAEQARLARVKRVAAQKALHNAQREQDKVQRDIAEERESLEREAFRRGRTPPPASFIRLSFLSISHLRKETATNEQATEVLRAESGVEHAESMLQQNQAKLRDLLARRAKCPDKNIPPR